MFMVGAENVVQMLTHVTQLYLFYNYKIFTATKKP